MNTFLVFTLLFSLVVVSMQDHVKSVTLKTVDTDSAELPINLSYKQCGGAGKLIVSRNLLCKDSSDESCKAPGSNKDDIKFEHYFVPSKDLSKVSYKISLTLNEKDSSVDHDGEIADGSAKKGKLAQIAATISAASDFGAGNKLSVKYELYDSGDKSVELCIEDKYEIV